jgi:4-hydroxyproline epimerase
MCGHGTIGTVTIAIEQGLVSPKTPGQLRLETPAGPRAGSLRTSWEKGEIRAPDQCPGFFGDRKLGSGMPDLGTLFVDVAYGGNFYAIVDVQPNFPGLEHFRGEQLIGWAREMRRLDQRTTYLCPPGKPDHSG